MIDSIIEMTNGESCLVLSRLGGGGQGEVFKVRYSGDNKEYALKIYNDDESGLFFPGSPFIKNLEKNIRKGPPDKAFIWPRLLTKPFGQQNSRMGYMMDLYDNEIYCSFGSLVNSCKVPKSKVILVKMLLLLAHAFNALHSEGLSYQDLNDGGVVFDYESGDIKILDNDNVAPYSENFGVRGKQQYVAPEVAIGLCLPDAHSDRFSLAILFFMLLTHSRPFVGKLELNVDGPVTVEVFQEMNYTHPIFVYDPDDLSNRPDKKRHACLIKHWETLPLIIQKNFIKTFTSGLPCGRTEEMASDKKDEVYLKRQHRTSDDEWTKSLFLWFSNIVFCPICNSDVYIESGESSFKCPHCKGSLSDALVVLQIFKGNFLFGQITLDPSIAIYKLQVSGEFDFSILAKVIESTIQRGYYAIKNLSNENWEYWECNNSQQHRLCKKGKNIPLYRGIEIRFDARFTGKVVKSKY